MDSSSVIIPFLELLPFLDFDFDFEPFDFLKRWMDLEIELVDSELDRIGVGVVCQQ